MTPAEDVADGAAAAFPQTGSSLHDAVLKAVCRELRAIMAYTVQRGQEDLGNGTVKAFILTESPFVERERPSSVAPVTSGQDLPRSGLIRRMVENFNREQRAPHHFFGEGSIGDRALHHWLVEPDRVVEASGEYAALIKGDVRRQLDYKTDRYGTAWFSLAPDPPEIVFGFVADPTFGHEAVYEVVCDGDEVRLEQICVLWFS